MSTYADLRAAGTIVVSGADAGSISGLRRKAKADGLAISTFRLGNPRDMSRDQARRRPYSVSLVHPDNPTTVVAPDAE